MASTMTLKAPTKAVKRSSITAKTTARTAVKPDVKKATDKSVGKVKNTVKKGATAVKNGVKKGANAVKTTAKKATTKVINYKTALKEAYYVGYNSGFADAQHVKVSSAGARASAKTGYGQALKNKNRIDKYTGKVKK